MNRKYTLALALLLPVSLLLAAACDKASPVAPAGTVLTLSVSPSQITADGTATVLVTALKPNGTPVNPGTQIRFSTTLGTIDPVAEIGDDGVATATLRGTGEIGTATVTARAGTTEAVTAEVQIGKNAGSVTVQASPTQVGEEGGTVRILAVVRDASGQPLAGATVNFQTELGTLSSGGGIVTTNARGEATDTLRLTPEDLQAFQGNQFNVRAVVGGASGATVSDSTTVQLRKGPPTAAFRALPAGGNSVFFDNETTGSGAITYEWNFGDGETSTETDPVHPYDSPGRYTVTLTARNDRGTDVEVKTIDVPLAAAQ